MLSLEQAKQGFPFYVRARWIADARCAAIRSLRSRLSATLRHTDYARSLTLKNFRQEKRPEFLRAPFLEPGELLALGYSPAPYPSVNVIKLYPRRGSILNCIAQFALIKEFTRTLSPNEPVPHFCVTQCRKSPKAHLTNCAHAS